MIPGYDGKYQINYFGNVRRALKRGYKVLHPYIKTTNGPRNPLNYDNCDLADCEKYFKRKVPVETDRKVEIGKTYRHFKGHTVKVIAISQDTEAPGQFYVVYKCEDGAIWSRPYGMFVSEVDHVKYPNVKQKYRFELMEDETDECK